MYLVHPTTVKLNNSEAIFFLLLMAIKLSTRLAETALSDWHFKL